MKIFNELLLKFEKSDWSANPEFCVIDTILVSRPDIILMLNQTLSGMKELQLLDDKIPPVLNKLYVQPFSRKCGGWITGNWNIHKTIPGSVQLL
jgi:hypothetical protein